jgi:nucleotide-binding universal stress UspA family protein
LVFPTAYYPGWGERDFNLYQERWEAFKKESSGMLNHFSAQANSAGVNTEFSQNVGSPGRVICELARVWQANLIFMGRRGRSGLTEILLGSVSNYVLHHAPCSVHIVNLPPIPQTQKVPLETVHVSS